MMCPYISPVMLVILKEKRKGEKSAKRRKLFKFTLDTSADALIHRLLLFHFFSLFKSRIRRKLLVLAHPTKG